MSKLKHRIVSLLLCFGMFISLAISGSETVIIDAFAKTNREIEGEISTLNQRKDKLEGEQKDLKQKISSAHSEANTLSSEISNLNYEIALLDEQIAITDELIAAYEQYIIGLEEDITYTEGRIAEEKLILDEMIRMSFEYSGTGSAIEFIFSAEDFGDLLSRIDLLGYHLSYNDRVIENYNNSLNELEQKKASYEVAKAELETARAEKAEKSAELEGKRNVLETKKQVVLADADEYENELAEKQRYINELDAEIKDLAEMLKDQEDPAAPPYSGTFTFPLPSGVYRITSYYGNRKDPFTGKASNHSGYDFACAKGTSIFAADSGTVVMAKWNGGYGNCVIINHGGGIMTLYGHCSELLVTQGQKVTRGQVIARVGTTGRSTGNHLHFEVRKNGYITDPSPYIGL